MPYTSAGRALIDANRRARTDISYITSLPTRVMNMREKRAGTVGRSRGFRQGYDLAAAGAAAMRDKLYNDALAIGGVLGAAAVKADNVIRSQFGHETKKAQSNESQVVKEARVARAVSNVPASSYVPSSSGGGGGGGGAVYTAPAARRVSPAWLLLLAVPLILRRR